MVIAKAQFIACSGYDVIEANFSPRVSDDNFIALWKKEIRVIELLTICQTLSLAFCEERGGYKLGYVICLIFHGLSQIFLAWAFYCYETQPKRHHSVKSFRERACIREGCCWELDVTWSFKSSSALDSSQDLVLISKESWDFRDNNTSHAVPVKFTSSFFY